MQKFSYLLEKIASSDFKDVPFPHVRIENFFDTIDFDEILSDPQICISPSKSTKELLDKLRNVNYEPIAFPGSITDEASYLQFIENKKFKRNLITGYGRHVIEGYGITYRLKNYQSLFLSNLMDFFSSDSLHACLKDKFNIKDEVSYEGGVQKNLKGYEISPHPDTSRNALTWMVNIYTDPYAYSKEMHTHLCTFKPKYKYIECLWQHSKYDPVWVPWDWTETVATTKQNNSIIIFKPDHSTLHAVKVSEDHLIHQRNQIYGNLWYAESLKKDSMPWQRLDLHKKPSALEKILRRFSLIS